MHHVETLARRIVDEVETVTTKAPVRWVTVQQIARRLRIHHSSAIAAVRLAVDRGWLIAGGRLLTVFAGPNSGQALAHPGEWTCRQGQHLRSKDAGRHHQGVGNARVSGACRAVELDAGQLR